MAENIEQAIMNSGLGKTGNENEQPQKINLGLENCDDGWYITGMPVYEVDGESECRCGPYDTKGEAESDRKGLTRFFTLEENATC